MLSIRKKSALSKILILISRKKRFNKVDRIHNLPAISRVNDAKISSGKETQLPYPITITNVPGIYCDCREKLF